MLPWLEAEITPRVAACRPAALRLRSAAMPRTNVRGLIEGQMMAIANHASAVSGTIDRVIATGGAAVNAAHPAGDGERVRRGRRSPRRRELSRARRRAPRLSRRSAGGRRADLVADGRSSGFTDPDPSTASRRIRHWSRCTPSCERDYAILENTPQGPRAHLLTVFRVSRLAGAET